MGFVESEPMIDRAYAQWYDSWVRGAVVHKVAIPALLELCLPGDEVLDVACGQGAFSRALAARGYSVTAIDLSPELIEVATRMESDAPLGIRYLVGDARTLDGVATAAFDGVTSCLALTDIDDLTSAFGAVNRVLKPDGWFAIATVHPCFETPHAHKLDEGGVRWSAVAHYFEEGHWVAPEGRGPRAIVGSHHRRLSTILNQLVDTGFELHRFVEPKGPPEVTADHPHYGEVAEILGVRALKKPQAR